MLIGEDPQEKNRMFGESEKGKRCIFSQLVGGLHRHFPDRNRSP
jgi:hypothetical protein